MEEISRLTALFERLGAKHPEQWARSQIEEDIPQLARFLFLRQAWRLVVERGDDTWISESRAAAAASPDDPGSAIGPALERLLAIGASEKDLSVIVRTMQWKVLAGLCYLLDDPGITEDDVRDIAWRLFQVDEKDQPVAVISGLHESVLETEPSGLEMRDE